MAFLIRILTKYLLKENKIQLSITDRLGKMSSEIHLSFWHSNVYKYFVRVLEFVRNNMLHLNYQLELFVRRCRYLYKSSSFIGSKDSYLCFIYYHLT